MAKRIAMSTLNASTIDIINTIRQNAGYEYQASVPLVETEHDIPKVGEILYGYPALANKFINELVNRIALVRVNSATFNNAYAELKKGYLEFGETVEEVFVNISKAREFSVEKAADRELKRSLPDVKTAFHAMNWRVQYPVTIQDEDLRMAFLSMSGVQDLIARIVDSVYTAAEYDEYLLFKYLMIKAITKGAMYPVQFDDSDMHNAAKEFRGFSNLLTFMGTKYNASGVHTVTPKEDQYIFMDSGFNANYDVDVLASAFNMDKADFMGKLKLIDSWNTFDNDRFTEIVANSDQIEVVTEEELALMANVKAVLVDKEWFQVYDNQNKFTEKYVASGEYWNYFYNVWKTISSSPFSNAIVFVGKNATITLPATFTAHVDSKSESKEATVLTFTVETLDENPTLADMSVNFVQDETSTKNGIAIHPYGAVIIPASKVTTKFNIYADIDGTSYKSAVQIDGTTAVDSSITMNKETNTLNVDGE